MRKFLILSQYLISFYFDSSETKHLKGDLDSQHSGERIGR